MGELTCWKCDRTDVQEYCGKLSCLAHRTSWDAMRGPRPDPLLHHPEPRPLDTMPDERKMQKAHTTAVENGWEVVLHITGDLDSESVRLAARRGDERVRMVWRWKGGKWNNTWAVVADEEIWALTTHTDAMRCLKEGVSDGQVPA